MYYGNTGNILRVDLGKNTLVTENPDPVIYKKWIGGTGLGTHYLISEVSPEITWDHPENRVIIAAGPMSGTQINGSGMLSVVTRGPMTGGACSTQANGFFAAYLKLCGFDAVILQGISLSWVYLYVDDTGYELRDASHLLGLDTWEVQETLDKETEKKLSVFSIGPAGENLVRFAILAGDKGHVASKNGVGAVLGNKRIKAVAVARGKKRVPVKDPAALTEAVRDFKQTAFSTRDTIAKYGTNGLIPNAYKSGHLPVKNLTTNVYDHTDRIDGAYMRGHFKLKPHPCYACNIVSHCHQITVTEGEYAGYTGDEPETENTSLLGPNIGVSDAGAIVVMSDQIDRLGLDVNECGWVLGWVIECYEKDIFTREQTGGLELKWGNEKAVLELLRQIAHRSGFGALLSDGVKVAAKKIGGEAKKMAVYTEKGNSPRGHDHRAVWLELLDTCTSSTGTIESSISGPNYSVYGIEPVTDKFDWRQVATYLGKINGHRNLLDCLGACRFTVDNPVVIPRALTALTGYELTLQDCLKVGRRISNALRVFNLRCGITKEMERPSERYGSTPVDGPVRGTGVSEIWDDMVDLYFKTMGWDPTTGAPLPETLQVMDLEELID